MKGIRSKFRGNDGNILTEANELMEKNKAELICDRIVGMAWYCLLTVY
ncbi:MAG: hypothetical protein ACOC6P_00180 [Candidatus Aminicenantaceae bacterium]